ncbi:MAG: FAD-dependent oxidoreductase [Gammaproteobacteria bacterium]|nr:MAG: FAD-dependent oxidoreductase [Gammaproteobacteria bacterium]
MRGVRQIYPFTRPPELDSDARTRVPVIVVGAGPIGMAMGLDLDLQGIPNIILDDDNKVSIGSRAICWAKRALEVADRLGCGERMLDKGVTWNLGKVFFGDRKEPVYAFNMLAEGDQQFPGFINLQQYYAEEYLIEEINKRELTAIRWENEVTAVDQSADGVTISVSTPQGEYKIDCDYVIAADGARSPLRKMLGYDFGGETFQDHFLIADIRMKAEFPAERWFWFDPPFNRGQSALLHKQPDDVWRLDFQLGWDIDRKEELRPENVSRRIRAMLGEEFEFEFEWVSIYTFQCRRMDRFVHDRIIFTGDAAHLVSPFGARGANSGLQDVDNLGWKLALILKGKAPVSLLESYNDERVTAAKENILNSTRATDFITPKNAASRTFRDATLELASEHEFARCFVNSGRLSVATTLDDSGLNTADSDSFDSKLVPGSPATDAPVKLNGKKSWFLKSIGNNFTGVYFAKEGANTPAGAGALEQDDIPVKTLVVSEKDVVGNNLLLDHKGLLKQRLDGQPGTYYLFRPDQHVVARWRDFDLQSVRDAVARATMQTG